MTVYNNLTNASASALKKGVNVSVVAGKNSVVINDTQLYVGPFNYLVARKGDVTIAEIDSDNIANANLLNGDTLVSGEALTGPFKNVKLAPNQLGVLIAYT